MINLDILYNILSGDGRINKYTTLRTNGQLNIELTSVDDGVMVNFLTPEPIITISKIINITDKIDYVKLMLDGTALVKTRGWPAEISINLEDLS